MESNFICMYIYIRVCICCFRHHSIHSVYTYIYLVRQTKYKHVTTSRCRRHRRHRRRLDCDVTY
jgi:hypothetical protein